MAEGAGPRGVNTRGTILSNNAKRGVEAHGEVELTTHRKEAGSPESISTDTFSNVTSNDEADIIVVGAGVLGAAFAAVMARDGRKVMVVEKDMKEPDQFAGEVMQPGGFQMLKELGLADSMEGFDASPLTGYSMYDFDNKDNMHLHFPLGENKKVKEGRSFFHGRFAVGLRKLAMAEPKVRFIEGTVTRLLEEEGYVTGVLYKEKETGNIKKGMNDIVAGVQQYQSSLLDDLRKQVERVLKKHLASRTGQLEKDVMDIFDNLFDPFAGVATFHQDSVIKKQFSYLDAEEIPIA
ncbi:squalene monooxygenase-like [Protopterus annectens]|uniref:squalene monooxygenase-like n=1 Tax=Protopterus annectens TaxID=7888 RepID=UPI001CFAAD62|nr:squalene monooxygenase-like [Protopterus annectens]